MYLLLGRFGQKINHFFDTNQTESNFNLSDKDELLKYKNKEALSLNN